MIAFLKPENPRQEIGSVPFPTSQEGGLIGGLANFRARTLDSPKRVV